MLGQIERPINEAIQKLNEAIQGVKEEAEKLDRSPRVAIGELKEALEKSRLDLEKIQEIIDRLRPKD